MRDEAIVCVQGADVTGQHPAHVKDGGRALAGLLLPVGVEEHKPVRKERQHAMSGGAARLNDLPLNTATYDRHGEPGQATLHVLLAHDGSVPRTWLRCGSSALSLKGRGSRSKVELADVLHCDDRSGHQPT